MNTQTLNISRIIQHHVSTTLTLCVWVVSKPMRQTPSLSVQIKIVEKWFESTSVFATNMCKKEKKKEYALKCSREPAP